MCWELFLIIDLFSQHYKMSLKIYHFICHALHHPFEVFKSQNILGLLSETQKCRFSHRISCLLCSCGDSEAVLMPALSLPLFPGFGSFRCSGREDFSCGREV